jgi:type II secretory pathway predicted ATPase ExeA
MSPHSDFLSTLGLYEHPFAPTADPAYFYATPLHRACLESLWGSMEARHGAVVVLGDSGAGKTMLLRKVAAPMLADPETYVTAVIGAPVPTWTSFDLLRHIVEQFGLQPREESFVACTEALNEHLLENRHRVCTLFIDDAHLLNKRGQLELLRILLNLETQQHKLLNIVLFAQKEWTGVLQAAPDFTLRVNAVLTLQPLPLEEVGPLLQFRLVVAGRQATTVTFSDTAIRAIHAYGAGNLRVMLMLSRHALGALAHAAGQEVGHAEVLRVIDHATIPNAEKRDQVLAAIAGATPPPSTEPAPAFDVAETAPAPALEPVNTEQLTRDQRAAELLLRAQLRQGTVD